LEVIGYSYFDGGIDSIKSTSGYIFLLTESAISWRSNKQTIVVMSTMEAGFIAYYEATTQVLWMINFVKNLKIVNSIARPINIFYNNFNALFFLKNNTSRRRSKHIDILYLNVKRNIKRYDVSIEHINTKLIIVNPTNKSFPVKQNKSNAQHIRLINSLCT
jgi:hypothetical protein